MSIRSIKTGTFSRKMLVGNTAFDPAATFLIERVSGTGSSGTITFNNIPQNYKHLQIRSLAKTDDSASPSTGNNILIQFNSDSGSNYARHSLLGDGSSVQAAASASSSSPRIAICTNSGTGLTNVMGVSVIDIHDYASTTKNKTVRGFTGTDANGSGQVRLTSVLWNSTSAITSLSLYISGVNFTSSSTFALYGIVG
jgi:hypothetical protein